MRVKIIQWNNTHIICSVRNIDTTHVSITFYRPDNASEIDFQLSSEEIKSILCKDIGQEYTDDDIDKLAQNYSVKLTDLVGRNETSSSSRCSQLEVEFSSIAANAPVLEEYLHGKYNEARYLCEELIASNPQDPLLLLDMGKIFLKLEKFDEALGQFKQAISLVRRRCRHGSNSSGSGISTTSTARSFCFTVNEVSFVAYCGMGQAYEGLGKCNRAVTCYVLALKFHRPPQTTLNSSLPPPPPLSGTTAVIPSSYVPLPTAVEEGFDIEFALKRLLPARSDTGEVDIEEALSLHSVQHIDEPFQFSCTMCGECCRTSDNIMLSPHDIFLMTRSSALGMFNASTTTSLNQHDYFKGVFHYTRKGGYPICYLRPVKQAESRGHCHFAYPLYSTRVKQPKIHDPSYDVSKGVDYAELERQERNDIAAVNKSPESNKSALLSFEEYFTKSLAIDMAKDGEEQYNDTSDSLDANYDEDAEGAHGSDNDSGSEESEGPDWSSVLNIVGKQALGCMLGPSHMPTMCASYPVAPELSQADFWHVRRSFWRRENSGNKGEDIESSVHKLAPGWQLEEMYVVVNAPACEGFPSHIMKDAESVPSQYRREKTPIQHGQLIEPGRQNRISEERTMRQFLGENSGDVLDRWEESQWFMGLVEDISCYLPIDMIQSREIELAFVNKLALIWYNFDSLRTARSRLFKSYKRLKKTIETLTWTLVRETRRFITSDTHVGSNEATCVEMYHDLLNRLNIM